MKSSEDISSSQPNVGKLSADQLLTAGGTFVVMTIPKYLSSNHAIFSCDLFQKPELRVPFHHVLHSTLTIEHQAEDSALNWIGNKCAVTEAAVTWIH
jgi:hypothetical protein